MTKFAAYDENSIYAVGDTPEAARAAALAELGPDASPIDVAPISDEFAAWIEEHGWEGKRDSFERDRSTGFLVDATGRAR